MGPHQESTSRIRSGPVANHDEKEIVTEATYVTVNPTDWKV